MPAIIARGNRVGMNPASWPRVRLLDAKLQVPPEIHPLMKNAHNQNAIRGLAVENRMTGGFDLLIAEPDIARVASEVGKRRQPLEGCMQPQDVLFRADEAPLR